ncbi:MAG TPA: helix-turn-helix domain-containing protein [Steroidobacteraceae bacterium]|nr:helix-turn-helix domain-containing protein [Steroidobacteraceae bacterium]
MLTMTVDEAATAFGVRPKTIREWISEGLPCHRRGDKGLGNGAIIDAARAPAWVINRRQLDSSPPWTEHFGDQEQSNPLRMVVEWFADGVPEMITGALLLWLEDGRWRPLGCTEEQAREAAGELYLIMAMALTAYKGQFDTGVSRRMGGADLDDLASLLLRGSVRSDWLSLTVPITERIRPLIPSAIAEKMAARAQRRKSEQ